MPNDRRERIELALDIMVSLGKLLGSYVFGLKYDGMVVVMAPIVRYDSSLIFETLVYPCSGIGRQNMQRHRGKFSPRQKFQGIVKNGFRIRIKSQNNGGMKGDPIVLDNLNRLLSF